RFAIDSPPSETASTETQRRVVLPSFLFIPDVPNPWTPCCGTARCGPLRRRFAQRQSVTVILMCAGSAPIAHRGVRNPRFGSLSRYRHLKLGDVTHVVLFVVLVVELAALPDEPITAV